MDAPVITLLVQDMQHLRKLRGLIPLLPKDVRVDFLLDTLFAPNNTPSASDCPAGPNISVSDLSNYLALGDASLSGKPKRSVLDLCLLATHYMARSRFLAPFKPSYKSYSRWCSRTLRRFFPYIHAYVTESGRYIKAYLWPRAEQALRNYAAAKRPSIVFMAEANVQYVSEAFIKIFHEHGVPSYIVPYTFCTADEPAHYYHDNPLYTVRWYHPHRLNPSWFYDYRGVQMVRLPLLLAEYFDKHGYTPPLPWVLESSTADGILVESEAMREHYISQNIHDKQLIVLGDIAHDQLSAALSNVEDKRKVFCNDHGLDGRNKKWLVFAVFPDLYEKLPEPRDFKSYTQAIDSIIDSLSALEGWNVILSIHPSLDPKKFMHYETKSIRISKWASVDIVGLCDLYIANISATIRWAIAAGVPVINYDVYRYGYADYRNVEGVITVDNWNGFKAVLDKTTRDGDYLKSLADLQRKEAAKWGLIDGQYAARFKALVQQHLHSQKNKEAV